METIFLCGQDRRYGGRMTTSAPQHPFAALFSGTNHAGRFAASRIDTVVLDPGAVLFDQGEFDDRLFILDAGLLEVSILSAEGRKLSLNQLVPAMVFGEIALLDPGPRTARVEAVHPSRLRAVGRTALLDSMRETPKLALEILELTGKRLRWVSRQVEEQVFLPPTARLAAKMLYLMGTGNEIAMSQERLATFVGVSREVVSKTLAKWQRAGVIDVARGKVVALDKDALKQIRDTVVV